MNRWREYYRKRIENGQNFILGDLRAYQLVDRRLYDNKQRRFK